MADDEHVGEQLTTQTILSDVMHGVVERIAGIARSETEFAAGFRIVQVPTLHQTDVVWYSEVMSEEELNGVIHSDPEIMGGT